MDGHFLAVALFASSTGVAVAQSAEETALYIMTGIEDGTIIKSKTGIELSRYEKLSDSPLLLKNRRLSDANGMSDVGTTVLALSDCRYRIENRWTQDKDGKTYNWFGWLEADFSPADTAAQVVANDASQGPVGYIEYPAANIRSEVKRDDEHIKLSSRFAFHGQQDRLIKAIAYMKAKFCKGRAF